MSTHYFDAIDEYYVIETAIKNGDLAYARELLRSEHQANPTAETFYLSALVAHTAEQRVSLLQHALELKPDYEAAALALEQSAQPPSPKAKSTFFLTRIGQALFDRLS